MKNKSLILFVLLFSSQCFSSYDPDTQLTVSPSLLHFDYTEFSTTGRVLDRELGWLPGIDARLAHSFTESWSINIHGAYYRGRVDYDGSTQQGIPHSTDTMTRLTRFGARAERVIYKKTSLFIGAQAHRWNRNIQDNNNISGISETYKWLEYNLGLNSYIYINQKDILSFEAAYLLTRNATIDVDLSRVDLGTATLNIGDGSGGRLALNWKRTSENNFNYGLSLFYEAWNFGRSNTKRTSGGASSVFVTEPRSETRNIGLKFNIEYMF